MHFKRLTQVLVLSIIAIACGGDDPSGPPYASFDGEWRGGVAGLGLRVVVTDVDGDVNGSGTISGVTNISLTITGGHDHPDVEFSGMSPGFQSFTFSGEFEDANTVEGRADGSGFDNERVILTRQP